MTIDALETLLSGYKHWRDIGNHALIGGLIAEVVVIAVVSEHWKYKWTCELAAGIVVLVGVWTEVTYSGYADEIERQIRQQSNKQIALLNRKQGMHGKMPLTRGWKPSGLKRESHGANLIQSRKPL
jgi:hypothetical protein